MVLGAGARIVPVDTKESRDVQQEKTPATATAQQPLGDASGTGTTDVLVAPLGDTERYCALSQAERATAAAAVHLWFPSVEAARGRIPAAEDAEQQARASGDEGDGGSVLAAGTWVEQGSAQAVEAACALQGDVFALQRGSGSTLAGAAGACPATDGEDAAVMEGAERAAVALPGGAPWIAWQVPSASALAATAPGSQRALLKDALVRTLAANGLRLQAKAVHAFLCAPQPEILAALQSGPTAAGEAAATLRAHAAAERRRGPGRL